MVVTAMLFTRQTVFNDNQQGFSLVELLIALAILALSMLAAASMQFGSIRNNASGNMVTQANMLAKAKMEELKSTTDLSTLGPGEEAGIDAAGQAGGIYKRSWTVESLGSTARRITVTVQWTKGSRTRSVSITSNTRGNGV
jgi:prepilin-type N-terminal cleavage/methylation domain-containing protein